MLQRELLAACLLVLSLLVATMIYNCTLTPGGPAVQCICLSTGSLLVHAWMFRVLYLLFLVGALTTCVLLMLSPSVRAAVRAAPVKRRSYMLIFACEIMLALMSSVRIVYFFVDPYGCLGVLQGVSESVLYSLPTSFMLILFTTVLLHWFDALGIFGGRSDAVASEVTGPLAGLPLPKSNDAGETGTFFFFSPYVWPVWALLALTVLAVELAHDFVIDSDTWFFVYCIFFVVYILALVAAFMLFAARLYQHRRTATSATGLSASTQFLSSMGQAEVRERMAVIHRWNRLRAVYAFTSAFVIVMLIAAATVIVILIAGPPALATVTGDSIFEYILRFVESVGCVAIISLGLERWNRERVHAQRHQKMSSYPGPSGMGGTQGRQPLLHADFGAGPSGV